MTTDTTQSDAEAAEVQALKERVAELERLLHAISPNAEQGREIETLRKQAELIEIAYDAIFIRSLDGVIIYWNKGAERMYGIRREEAKGRISHELLNTTFPLPLPEIERALLDQGHWEGELKHETSRGARIIVAGRWVLRRDSDGHPEVVLEINKDITARKAAEEERELQAQRLRQQAQLLDLAYDAIILWRIDGTLTYWNQGAEQMYGYTAGEVIGAQCHNLLRTRFPIPLPEIEKILITEHHWQGELVHTRRDGGTVVVDSRWVARLGSGDTPTMVMQINTDITARKEAERIRAEQHQLIRLQAAAIAELSTPLIPITDEVVVMPLIGVVDTMRAQQVMDTLLQGLSTSRAAVAIIDITGVKIVDTRVADALLRVARGARLLGAEVVLTGIRPEVAQTIVSLGVEMQDIATRGTLRDGIAYALAKPGSSRSSTLSRIIAHRSS